MKIVQINSVCGSGSTGKICVGISQVLSQHGIENYILYTTGFSEYPYAIKCTGRFQKLQALRSRILGNYGFNSREATTILISKLEQIKPDMVHLHNLHGHNVHLGILFSYLKDKNIKVFWTFHDCWAFTGYCPYYDIVACNRWQTGCQNCPQRSRYSWFFDRSNLLYKKKMQLFSEVDLTIITPSQWLADQVKQSFLKDYPVKVIHNGIDLSVFAPKKSEFREKYHISEDKYILLGVAVKWVPRKGADVFIRLAQRLDPGKFQIVLVGTDDTIDKQLPANIISIHRTANQAELAEVYSAADLFVNPTREEVLGLVNIESLACGTPVVTYRTGGSPECIDEKTGIVVDRNDEEALYHAILHIAAERLFAPEDCRARACLFSEEEKFMDYIKLYEHACQ